MATTKIELAKAIYEKHGGISFREAKRIVDFILDTLRARLEEGDKVLLHQEALVLSRFPEKQSKL